MLRNVTSWMPPDAFDESPDPLSPPPQAASRVLTSPRARAASHGRRRRAEAPGWCGFGPVICPSPGEFGLGTRCVASLTEGYPRPDVKTPQREPESASTSVRNPYTRAYDAHVSSVTWAVNRVSRCVAPHRLRRDLVGHSGSPCLWSPVGPGYRSV